MRENMWKNLPDDILNTIAEKLIESERVTMKTSCKIWYNCVHTKFNNKNKETLPWTMYHENGTIKLFDPSAQKIYALKSIPKLLEDGWCSSDNTFCRFSKNGWGLFSNYKTRSIFFYSPFSNEVIDLPLSEERVDLATFSSTPTSPDCVTFFYHCPTHNISELKIQVCKVGDKSWKKFPLTRVGIGKTSLRQMVCCGNWLYCWLYSGTVHGFDLQNEERKVIIELPKERYGFPFNNKGFNGFDNLFVGFNGDLMIQHRRQKFWKLVECKREWISVSGKEEMIFDNYSHLLSISAIGNAEEFGGIVQLGWCENPITIPYPKSLLQPGFKSRIWIQPPFQTNK